MRGLDFSMHEIKDFCRLYRVRELQPSGRLSAAISVQPAIGGMSMIAKEDILSLSVSERIQLAQDIWDTIAEVPESVVLTDEQKAELDRRLDIYHRDPNAGSPWSVVRERFKSRT